MAQITLSIPKTFEYVHDLVHSYYTDSEVRKFIGTLVDLKTMSKTLKRNKNAINSYSSHTPLLYIYNYVITEKEEEANEFVKKLVSKFDFDEFVKPLIVHDYTNTNYESVNNKYVNDYELVRMLKDNYKSVPFTIDNQHPLVWASNLTKYTSNDLYILCVEIVKLGYNQYDYDGKILDVKNKCLLFLVFYESCKIIVEEFKPTYNEIIMLGICYNVISPESKKFCKLEWSDKVSDNKCVNFLIDIYKNNKKDEMSTMYKQCIRNLKISGSEILFYTNCQILRFIDHYKIDINEPTSNGSYILQFVIQYGRWDLAQELVNIGAKIYGDDGKFLKGIDDWTILQFEPRYTADKTEHFKKVNKFIEEYNASKVVADSGLFSKWTKEDKEIAKKVYIKEFVKQNMKMLTLESF